MEIRQMQLQFSYKSTVVWSFRWLRFYPGPIEESRCTTNYSKKKDLQETATSPTPVSGCCHQPRCGGSALCDVTMGTYPYKFAEREMMSFSNLPGVRREGRRSIKKKETFPIRSIALLRRHNTNVTTQTGTILLYVCIYMNTKKRRRTKPRGKNTMTNESTGDNGRLPVRRDDTAAGMLLV